MEHGAWEIQLAGSRWQQAEVLSSHRASRHVAAPSLGHYASLSFVVIGGGKRTEISPWETNQLIP
jgi:hypothetical protein